MAWWTAIIGGAAGKVLEKIVDHIPNRKESLRNKEENLQRELDELSKKHPATVESTLRYAHVADELRKIRQQTKNIGD